MINDQGYMCTIKTFAGRGGKELLDALKPGNGKNLDFGLSMSETAQCFLNPCSDGYVHIKNGKSIGAAIIECELDDKCIHGCSPEGRLKVPEYCPEECAKWEDHEDILELLQLEVGVKVPGKLVWQTQEISDL
jgi:hypothetical protein